VHAHAIEISFGISFLCPSSVWHRHWIL